MAKAVKLPSGNYICRVWDKYQKKQVSFTADTKKEAERQANLYKYNLKASEGAMLFEEAYDLYVKAHPKWAPKTIADYKRWKETRFAEFMPLPLSAITDEMLQKFADEYLQTLSPKSVVNILTPLKATMKRYRPHTAVIVSIPKGDEPKLDLPSDATVRALLEAVEDTEFIIPVYLAAFGAMRRGEIAALTEDHIDFKTRKIFIEYNVSKGEDKIWHLKPPKNGDPRTITVPQIVIDKIKKYGLPEIKNPDNFSTMYGRFIRKKEIKHHRFHDLRHYCAAKMLSIPLPISVVQEYGGWKDEKTLMKIYNYVIEEVRDKSMKMWNEEAEKLVTN